MSFFIIFHLRTSLSLISFWQYKRTHFSLLSDLSFHKTDMIGTSHGPKVKTQITLFIESQNKLCTHHHPTVTTPGRFSLFVFVSSSHSFLKHLQEVWNRSKQNSYFDS